MLARWAEGVEKAAAAIDAIAAAELEGRAQTAVLVWCLSLARMASEMRADVPERTARSEAEGGERGHQQGRTAHDGIAVEVPETWDEWKALWMALDGGAALLANRLLWRVRALAAQREDALRECGRLRGELAARDATRAAEMSEYARMEEQLITANEEAAEASRRAYEAAQEVSDMRWLLARTRLGAAAKANDRLRRARGELRRLRAELALWRSNQAGGTWWLLNGVPAGSGENLVRVFAYNGERAMFRWAQGARLSVKVRATRADAMAWGREAFLEMWTPWPEYWGVRRAAPAEVAMEVSP